jgi:hypothetical protein
MPRKDLTLVINELNTLIIKRRPEQLSSSWIYYNAPKIYQYIWKYVRTENNEVDWDYVTRKIDKSFAKKWVRYRYKNPKLYENKPEVDLVLEKYKDKLYTFLGLATDDDRKIQDRIVIRLVRLGQRGNISAQKELISWVTHITNDWIDRYPQMYKWQGYSDEVEDKIKACIRCYRYTGSFLGYLFKTLEYSARGKPPVVSLDDKMFDGESTRIDYVVVEE